MATYTMPSILVIRESNQILPEKMWTKNQSSGPPTINPAKEVTDIRKRIENVRGSNKLVRNLKAVVQNHVEPIDNALLLGLGCYWFQDDEHEGHRPFLGQLVIFLDLIKFVSNIQAQVEPRKSITMFTADPSFEDLDVTILNHYNVKVVPHAATYQGHVGSSTFVFSAYAYHDIEAGVVRQRPGLYLGTDCKKRFEFYDQQINCSGAADREVWLQVVQGRDSFEKFAEQHSEMKFPDASGTPRDSKAYRARISRASEGMEGHSILMGSSKIASSSVRSHRHRGSTRTGSMKSPRGPGWYAKRMYQLLVFLDVADYLSGAQSGQKIKMIASDPAFDDIDKKFLGGLNIEIIDMSSADSTYENQWNVGPSTFVFAAHIPFEVDLDIVSRNPGLYLGPDWKGRPNFFYHPDHAIERKTYEVLLHGCIEKVFPSAINNIDRTKAIPEGWEELERLTLGAVESMCFYWPKKYSTEEQAELPMPGEHYAMHFIRCQNAWNSSRFRSELRTLLCKEFEYGQFIDTAVLLGMGSISDQHRPGQYNKNTTLNQLVIFLDIVEYLSDAHGGRKLKILASDPNFHEIDKKMLQDLGIQIIHENDCELESGPSSFVFAAKLPRWHDVKVISQEPGLYLGPSQVTRKRNIGPESVSVERPWGTEMVSCSQVYEDFFQQRIESFFPSVERYGEVVNTPEGWQSLKKLTGGAVTWMAFYWLKIEAFDRRLEFLNLMSP
ncbi:uncharacterized protein BDZ99DRAFT_517172 [Mytilinidion resinicola]|uniref:SRR1-like domain-containing protein n=1 Tax=Mytilinidion resinicola TaxID=574789 RepID=A0A6A6YWT8_9PEZI|nr:uncharacterized protein BDZ99DRAFT_517172 [Mytilinidion resinicola]KAF2812863.1 hypothetical protein BDZ99DRAFT_517172 [Mytilinidion resinicola]